MAGAAPISARAADLEQPARADRPGLVEELAGRAERSTIPWGYGDDRVTAMAVDPVRLFAYWELTDGAIERARARLGPSGGEARLNLRVHDTTGRLFDGTNAHSCFDHHIERGDRDAFFEIGKPGSDAFVEIGLLSGEGTFAKIARSGVVAFPRREAVAWRDPEWMTVRVHTGEVVHAGTRPAQGAPSQPSRAAGGDAARGDAGANGHDGSGAWQPGGGALPAGEWQRSFEPARIWRVHLSWEELLRSGLELRERIAWEEVLRESWSEGRGTVSWEGPAVITSWEAGPFTYPVEVAAPAADFVAGPSHTVEIGGRTHIVVGPWSLVIRGLGAHSGGQVLQRWEIHRAWVSRAEHGVQVVGPSPREGRAGASEKLLGASDWRWLAASEERLRGASEVFHRGASERRLLGASETLFLAASERWARGASERWLLGASELRLRGASERLVRGASEWAWGGASERLLLGASDRLGASELVRRGASEGRLGASEGRLGAGDVGYPPPPAQGD